MADDLLIQSVDSLTRYTGPAKQYADSVLDKDDFLNMLVTQLKYQDPLEPMQDQEFIAQMAQFSTLEQMRNINETLTESLNWDYLLSQTINNTMATSLIGREIKANGNDIYLGEEGDATVSYKLSGYANEVAIDVYDGSGELVDTIKQNGVGAGDQTLRWDGILEDGSRAQMGRYTFQVRAESQDGQDVFATPFMSGIVDGVEYQEGQAYLVVDGTRVQLSYVIEVGAPGTEEEG